MVFVNKIYDTVINTPFHKKSCSTHLVNILVNLPPGPVVNFAGGKLSIMLFVSYRIFVKFNNYQFYYYYRNIEQGRYT